MHTQTQNQSLAVRILIALLVLLGLGGIGGGVPMLLDPSGASLGLPPGLLDGLPIDSFVLPGVFLIVVMGVVPFALAYGLWRRARWAWLGTLAQGVALVAWICFQIALWGTPIAIQYIYLFWGFLLVALGWLPAVRGQFAVPED